ncbi:MULTISPECIES: acetoacetate decarboxylase [unclassified Streptomyces]|uniref:acetoacetate decarboxylase n=1 Tax=unclassified Streptomyces TaxID=2593676 RepID=UPI000DBA377A|nr:MULTISPECIES: acetoacetate decarboxylase [unclassified Streptomyces]MYT71988.1 acetoacetate decarboxylase [Streptomyces sp. SID8367]RAJ75370.1 acetoacetate decarboxylase [Streptomyces sp. PsTaAH-137]
MRAEEVRRHVTTPLTTPVYPPRATRFTDREYLNVLYRTDPEALRAVVPEPLEIDEPLVRFEIMKMGDVEGYGPYLECGQVVPVRLGDERGEYLHAMHLDNFGATAAGRELSAYPKTIGSPALFADHGALVGTLDYGTQRVATATMPYKWEPLDRELAREQITVPTYAVKIVPSLDWRLDSCRLVRTRITDVTVKAAYQGPARLQLSAHVMAPLADLPVLEVVSASHIVTDLTLAPMEPVHDYLAA